MEASSHTEAIQSNKVKKTYRLDADLVDKLGELAREHGTTATAELEQAIRRAIREPYESHTDSHTPEQAPDALQVLAEQLAVKDAQIGSLTQALLQAQEQTRASQLMQAQATPPQLPAAQDWKQKSLWDRIFKR